MLIAYQFINFNMSSIIILLLCSGYLFRRIVTVTTLQRICSTVWIACTTISGNSQ